MADIILITAIAIIAFMVIRRQLHRLRRGGCGCGNCNGCGGDCEKRA